MQVIDKVVAKLVCRHGVRRQVLVLDVVVAILLLLRHRPKEEVELVHCR